ncbi:MAG: winged helix-turn-helix transcriptional regulator [Candidatus Micrarchaeia archaeon]|jgi:Lrp/AsnC family transcriptional regulator for asnA, asnC and gidA
MAKILADKTDMKILYYLDLDARAPYSQIAKKVRLSVDAVQYRVAKMQKEGVIRGFYAVIDPSVLGYASYRFFIKLRCSTPKIEEKIISYFVADPQYWWVCSIDGFRDLGVACWLKSTNEFTEKKNELMGNFKENLGTVQESIHSAIYSYSMAYLAGKEIDDEEEMVLCRGKKTEIDELDWKILRIIANNARLSSMEIARTTGVTPATVLNRLRGMGQKGVIRRYRTIIDLGKLGYYWYKVEFMLTSQAVKKKMLEFFRKHPNIVYAYEAIGGPDLEAEIEVESYAKFREVLDEIRTKFGSEIESYQHLLWYKEHKITYLPKI